MRLIDADGYARDMKVRQDAALKWCNDAKTRCDYVDYELAETAFSIFCEAKLTLDKQPTVDAVPVARCRECKYYERAKIDVITSHDMVCAHAIDYHFYREPDDYCSRGERKGGAGDGVSD